MNADSNKKRLVAVWSRDADPSRLAGRTQMIMAIRRELSAHYQAENLRIHNVLENRSPSSIAGAVLAAVQSILTGRLPSLQCLLYCNRKNHKHILHQLYEDPPAILYCDGVRSFYLLKRMGALRQRMKIVVDFDDLMSRRMRSLGTTKTPLSLGYLHDKIPHRLRSALALGFISKAIARYEQSALTGVENLIGHWADAVVLISSVEAEALQVHYRESGCKAMVHAIPPPIEIVAPPQPYKDFSRFIFIGTDALPQNKLSIQMILDLWRSIQPKAEIHIFGHMVSHWPSVGGVVFEGYAPGLQDVYVKDSVLFAPGVLHGGLKTKVAEAFAHGCAVVGNDITFEGMHLEGNPLQIRTHEEMEEIIRSPLAHLNRMSASVISGQSYLRAFASREQFQRRWCEVLG